RLLEREPERGGVGLPQREQQEVHPTIFALRHQVARQTRGGPGPLPRHGAGFERRRNPLRDQMVDIRAALCTGLPLGEGGVRRIRPHGGGSIEGVGCRLGWRWLRLHSAVADPARARAEWQAKTAARREKGWRRPGGNDRETVTLRERRC